MKIIQKSLLALVCCAFLALAGCIGEDDYENMKVPRLMLESRGVNYGSLIGEQVTMPDSKAKISLNKEPLVNEFEIINVDLVKVELGLALLVQVSERGSRALYRASVTNNGNRVVLLINGNPVGARRLDGAIADGNLYTFVELPDDELEQLVIDIKGTIVTLQSKK
ncbi:MAG: hypothetical protein ACSHYA_08040 [Opitutaceae bacterium]